MFAIKSVTVLFFMIISVSHCQRRIKDGLEVTKDRKYMVYLVKAPKSDEGYDFWLCGGVIVTSEFVVTSAACIQDVEYIYVIAGYKKYIADDQIETDECTKEMKKKAIYTCSPKGYELKYGELDYWSYIDIALVKVDTAFDFEDARYEKLCSYKPTTIAINYEEKYQEPGTDALVLGWGHKKGWRLPGDTVNYNEGTLKYSPTLLLNKNNCIEHYQDYKNMSSVIQTYMICSLGEGNINDVGETIVQSLPIQTGCTSIQQKLLGFEGVSCEQWNSEENYDDDETRRHNRASNKTNNVSVSDFNEVRARRNGICQNDHGGPLVTWIGAREVLIGVASVFKVSDQYECMGPYLYTSTVCTGLFLDCILNLGDFPSRRADLCESPANERGYELIERTISWKDDIASPDNNENIGRMPKAKISAGLKYLTNNKQHAENRMNVEIAKKQEETRYDSNNMYSGNTNPAIVNSAPNERFKIKERYPENTRVSGENYPVSNGHRKETKYESNQMYRAANSPAILNYATNARFKIKESYPKNESISGMESFPVNDRSPGKQSFPVNYRYPANQSPSANQRQPVNQKYPVTGRYPVSMGSLKNPMNVPSRVAVRPQHPLRN